MSDALVFLACMIDGLVLLILSVYLIILLSDLECDFLNTKQGCKQLNKFPTWFHVTHSTWEQWVLPEIIATSFIPVVLLISWHWFLFLLSAPLAGYLIHRYVMLTPGSLGVYDATEIRNRGMLTNFTREAFIKIGYHLVMFFISLYCFIVALLIG